MRSFDQIYDIAASLKGGAAALETIIARPLPTADLVAIGDDRWLSAMARAIFQAGFSWKVIDAKWDGFESAFDGFRPGRVANYGPDDLDRLLADRGIVRNGPKISAVIENAVWLTDLAATHGSAGRCFAGWDDDDYIGLLDLLKSGGSRLGGNTGQRVLRNMGRSSFILSTDVVARLIAEGVVDKDPKSKSDMKRVQAAFNEWRAQSGRSLTEISRVLAMSTGAQPPDEHP